MNWLEECQVERKKLSLEKQQEFLNLMWSGMKLGEAAKQCEISFEQACGIMNHNIETTSTTILNTSAKV